MTLGMGTLLPDPKICVVVPGKTVECVVLRGKPGLPVKVPGRGNALGKSGGLVEVAGP